VFDPFQPYQNGLHRKKNSNQATVLRLAILCLVLVSFTPSAEAVRPGEVNPPDDYYRQVNRSFVAGKPFRLVAKSRPAFAIWVADRNDIVLMTAANDFAAYFQQRYGAAPRILHSLENGDNGLIVLSSVASLPRLPQSLRRLIRNGQNLPQEGFLIQQVQWPGNRTALVCVGGSSIGARYATTEILRKMQMGGTEATASLEEVRDEPYSTWRALYINDSAHQLNKYNPNLIYDVPTYRWSPAEWRRFIDQLAFFRYNVLQIWITPNMFSPDALKGGGAFDYFRDTLRAVAQYAKPRGITLDLINGINVAVGAGTRLDTIELFKDLPVYTYLSPNKPEEKALWLQLWDYWTKAIPEVGIWSLFPGDPGGCMEQACGPETYVDMAVELSKLIKRNNPTAVVDIDTWHFFGWGPAFTYNEYNKNHRVDRGYKYLLSKLKQFPSGTTFGLNINDFTSQSPIRGGGFGGGSAAEYIREISASGHSVSTWAYTATEGEGWVDHHYRVPEILAQRDIEARLPISGGICYTMSAGFNILNQFACSEGFWNPKVSEREIMERYTEGIFGSSEEKLAGIFPSFEIAPWVGYTFAAPPAWRPDYSKIQADMRHSASVLETLKMPEHPRFVLFPSGEQYKGELLSTSRLYAQLADLGLKVVAARELVQQEPAFKDKPRDSIRIKEAYDALAQMQGRNRATLQRLLEEIKAIDAEKIQRQVEADRYQIFLDYPSPFSTMLPNLVNWFFDSFGGDFTRSARMAP